MITLFIYYIYLKAPENGFVNEFSYAFFFISIRYIVNVAIMLLPFFLFIKECYRVGNLEIKVAKQKDKLNNNI